MLRRGEQASRNAEKHIHIHTYPHTGTQNQKAPKGEKGRMR